MASTLADRELLFEALAIHLGFATRRGLEEARRSLQPRRRCKPVPPGPGSGRSVHLDRRARGVLEVLVDDLLARHKGNLRQCLDALSAFGRLRHDLERRLAGLESQPSHRLAGPNGKESGRACPAAQRRALHRGAAGLVRRSAMTTTTMTTKRTSGRGGYAWSLAAPGSAGSRFEILHAHARGGIGVVSVAFDSELQREVALKQIKAESADDPDSRARFLLEAEVTGRLEHPGIVPVYGLGFDGQGRPYYAMRFVRGITLDEAISKFHAADASAAATRTSARSSCGSCWAGSSTSATPWPMPTAGGSCIATSSPRTSCWARTTRP